MRLRQLVVVGTVVCGLVGAAAAEGDASWDGRYEHTSGGGNEKCPDAVTVVVSGGTFSFPWNVRLTDRVYRVGTIAGSVRPSGFAVFKATLVDPLPRETQAALEDAGDTVEMLQTLASGMELVFSASGGRGFELTSGMCYASWSSGAAQPGKHGVAGKPAKAAGKPVKPPPPLGAGAPKWDATYGTVEHVTDAWWCPNYDGFGSVVVKKGRFSLPWHVDGVDGHGRDWGEITLGQIVGSIAASGAVKLRPWFAVSELPPELVDGRDAKEATLAYVKAHTPTMTFTTVAGRRHTHLAFGKACSYDLEVWDPVASKKQQLRSGGAAGSGRTASSSRSSTSSTDRSGGGSTSRSSHRDDNTASRAPARKGKANGAECDYASECASDHCNFNKCVSGDSTNKALGNGMACDYASECASDHCFFNKCSSGDDNKKDLGAGADCDFPSDCASGECNFHKCE
jgi:hypothetical protein